MGSRRDGHLSSSNRAEVGVDSDSAPGSGVVVWVGVVGIIARGDITIQISSNGGIKLGGGVFWAPDDADWEGNVDDEGNKGNEVDEDSGSCSL